MDDLPDLTLEPYPLPNRAYPLPTLYLVIGHHPLRRDPRIKNREASVGRTFVYFQDISPDVMSKLNEDLEMIRIPNADEDALRDEFGTCRQSVTSPKS